MKKMIKECQRCGKIRILTKTKICEECVVDLEGDRQQRIFMESLLTQDVEMKEGDDPPEYEIG